MDKKNYSTKQKVGHFSAGFFGNIIIGAVHFGLYFLFALLLNALGLEQETIVVIIFMILLVLIIAVVEFVLIRYFFKTKRYVAIGMLSSLILPLLITGFCSIVFYSAGTGQF